MTANHIDATITAVANDLDSVAWSKLGRGILAARRRDDTGSVIPDGFPTGTLGDGGSRATSTDTSTERAGLALAEELLRHDEHHELTLRSVAALLQIEQLQRRLVRDLKRIDEIAAKPAQAYVAPTCAEAHCEDPAAGGRRGRCEACYRDRKRRADAAGLAFTDVPPVAAETIDRRLAERENRKVHVNGPLASFT